MQNEKNKKAENALQNDNKVLSIVFWMLSLLCMGVIFYLSSRTSDESGAQSGALLSWLQNLLGTNALTDFIVRKLAHFLEFTGLCLLLSGAFVFSFGKNKMPWGLVCTSLYAATDELHQLFVPGRSCELRDWGIDTCGAVLGIFVFWLIYTISVRLHNKKPQCGIDIADK